MLVECLYCVKVDAWNVSLHRCFVLEGGGAGGGGARTNFVCTQTVANTFIRASGVIMCLFVFANGGNILCIVLAFALQHCLRPRDIFLLHIICLIEAYLLVPTTIRTTAG